jgi:hypothetical protein
MVQAVINENATFLIVSHTLLVLSLALALVSMWVSRPRTIHQVIGLLIWGPVLIPRLRRRFVIAAASYIGWILCWIAFVCLMGWQFGWRDIHDLLVSGLSVAVLLLIAMALFVAIGRLARFLPAAYLARLRRYEDILTIGCAALFALSAWFLLPVIR